MTEATQRLFFALWPPAEVRAALTAARSAVVAGLRRARAVPSDNLHLTLAFLGATDGAKRACYEAAANHVTAVPFVLTLDTIGFWRRSGVIWCGCEPVPAALADLQQQLVAALGQCGFCAEARPFAAHVTLVRDARKAPPAVPAIALQWPVSDFCLVQSVTYEDGARYGLLQRWALRVA